VSPIEIAFLLLARVCTCLCVLPPRWWFMSGGTTTRVASRLQFARVAGAAPALCH